MDIKLRNIKAICAFFTSVAVVCAKAPDSSKRLVLNGDEDLLLAIQTIQNKVSQLETKVAMLESSQVSTTSGSTYTRWGKMSCPGNGSDLVYNGYMAGNQWDGYAGGSNHLCLPDDPNWAKYLEGIGSGSKIHGTEIENAGHPELLTLLFGSDIDNQDISCAVCETSRRKILMIPGRVTCYDGWTLEYQGYVVAPRESWKGSSEFVCLDSNIDPVPHGVGNDDEHIVDVVEVQCGSQGGLPCPPYVQGRELACVVCSK